MVAYCALLRSVDIFASLTNRELSFVADVAESVAVPADEVIIQQGDESDAMYILQAGQCLVTMQSKLALPPGTPSAAAAAEAAAAEAAAAIADPAAESANPSHSGELPAAPAALVRVMREGAYFGERGLLDDERRSATVTTATSCRLLKIDKWSFV